MKHLDLGMEQTWGIVGAQLVMFNIFVDAILGITLSMALDSRVNRLEEKGVDRGRTWQ